MYDDKHDIENSIGHPEIIMPSLKYLVTFAVYDAICNAVKYVK
jgi:hypothetical protein